MPPNSVDAAIIGTTTASAGRGGQIRRMRPLLPQQMVRCFITYRTQPNVK
jgi:hypothetical protein